MADHIATPQEIQSINAAIATLKSIPHVNFEISYLEVDGLGRTFLCKYKNHKFSRFQVK